jgi:hypothetical protein
MARHVAVNAVTRPEGLKAFRGVAGEWSFAEETKPRTFVFRRGEGATFSGKGKSAPKTKTAAAKKKATASAKKEVGDEGGDGATTAAGGKRAKRK